MSSTHNEPRILFLDHTGELGGAELSLIDTVCYLRDRSKVILMADGPLRREFESRGVEVTVFSLPVRVARMRRNAGILQAIRSIPDVLWLASKISGVARKYDVVWANSQKSFVVGCFAAALAGRPLVWHMRDIFTAEHFSVTTRRIAVALANRYATSVVTVSKAGMKSFLDSKGRPDLVRFVYNGIDATRFMTPAVERQKGVSIREEFKIPDAPIVGLFGRLTAWKGQDVLIRALPDLPGVHCVLIGDALFKEQAYEAALRKLASDLGVADRTHFAGFRDDVAAVMREVDVVAHTSTSPEPFGRVLVEAMLARRPLIATNTGGAAEIVTHGEDGLLVQPGDPGLLATAIRSTLDDKTSTAIRTARGYITATTKFTLENYVAGINAVIDSVTRPGNIEPDPPTEIARPVPL